MRKEGAHLQLEILFQIWPKLKFYMDVAGKSICIIYCAFVIYSESSLIPTTMKLTTAACHIPIRYVHYLIVLGSAMWIIQECISLYEIFKERRGTESMNMILLLIGFVGLLAVGAPIVVAMGLPAIIYYIVSGTSLSLVAYSFYQSTMSFSLLAVPAFILMGNLVSELGKRQGHLILPAPLQKESVDILPVSQLY